MMLLLLIDVKRHCYLADAQWEKSRWSGSATMIVGYTLYTLQLQVLKTNYLFLHTYLTVGTYIGGFYSFVEDWDRSRGAEGHTTCRK